MPKGFLGFPRFSRLPPLVSESDKQTRPVFQSDEDVRKVAEQIIRRTPGEIREASFAGFFEEPSIFIDFFLPSDNFKTFDREHFTSSLTARAETGFLSEMSIRFPAIEVDDTDIDELQKFIGDIKSNSLFDVRIQVHDSIRGDEEVPEYHPHIHFSKTKRGDFGPPIQEEAREMNRMIRRWYSDVGQVIK